MNGAHVKNHESVSQKSQLPAIRERPGEEVKDIKCIEPSRSQDSRDNTEDTVQQKLRYLCSTVLLTDAVCVHDKCHSWQQSAVYCSHPHCCYQGTLQHAAHEHMVVTLCLALDVKSH